MISSPALFKDIFFCLNNLLLFILRLNFLWDICKHSGKYLLQQCPERLNSTYMPLNYSSQWQSFLGEGRDNFAVSQGSMFPNTAVISPSPPKRRVIPGFLKCTVLKRGSVCFRRTHFLQYFYEVKRVYCMIYL
jgi:hypothetical protein